MTEALVHFGHLIWTSFGTSFLLMGTTGLAVLVTSVRRAIPWVSRRIHHQANHEAETNFSVTAGDKWTAGAWLLVFAFVVVRNIYQDHQALVARNRILEAQIADLQKKIDSRTQTLKLTDPATGRMFEVIKTFALYRRHIGTENSCSIEITSPKESRETAMTVGQLAWVATFCSVVGPMDTNMSPDAEKRTTAGMENDLVVFHMAKSQSGDSLYSDLGSILRLKRSYDVPTGSPQNHLWLQFGTGKQWNNQ